MEFLFRHRGAGKRQVKPSQDIALLEDQLGAESSDDSEYKIGSDHEHSNESHGDDESSSSSNADGDDEDDEEASGDDANEAELAALQKDDHASLSARELLALSRQELDHDQLPKWVGTVKICGCCLGQSSSDANEIVECDGCGISVHEGCYGINETPGSVASTVSSASTEPWFCEPCRAGLEASPTCELCPLIGGVYKQTDVGRWVHLVCALYVPGVAFGDPENMTKVTIFEMNYSFWGRRNCSICALNAHETEVSGGVRLSRTGVCIQCDAGLCKAFFHVSCAQAAGLLSEPTYVTSSTHTAEAVMDAYLAHCKVHTDRTVIKRRRRSFLVHLVQSRLRRQSILSKRSVIKKEGQVVETADERILRKLSRSQFHYKAERGRGHEPWVPTQKLPRLLGTSASAIRKIQRLGEIHDLDIDRQIRQEVQVMSIVEAKKKWGVAPAFNLEFVAYYEDRERRIKDLKKQVTQDQKDFSNLRNEESEVTLKFDKVNKILGEATSTNDTLRKKVELLRSLLGMGGKDIPKAISKVVLSKTPSDATSASIKARSTAYSSMSSQASSSKHVKVCGICHKSHDQHLLAHCDTCQHHYHLGCLTPPLTRMPKKSKQYGWSCSECYPDSSDDDRTKQTVFDFDEDLSTEGLNRRRRQRRQAASKALLLASSSANNSDEENRIMKKALKESAKIAANGLEEKRDDLIAKAAAKAERKRKRKEEKARRKAEKKEAKRQRILEEAQNGTKDSDVEILDGPQVGEEDIPHKPIKLTIKTNGHQTHRRKSSTGSTGPAPKPKDIRTKCDKCEQGGDNNNLVRCDECRRCFHFGCLIPPVTKSPKRPGWGWHCNECDPSDRDSDWHLD